MAQAELNIAIDKLSGKIYGDSDVYIAHRYGKTVLSHYPRTRDPKKITPHQHELNTSFGAISKQAKAEMQDPERRAYWQHQYEQYKQKLTSSDKYYFTLRGFIIGQLTKQQIE